MSQDSQSPDQRLRLRKLKDSHLFVLMSLLVAAILLSVLAMGQVWQDGHQALQGNYEAAEVVDLGHNKYRMYYDIIGSQTGIYSAISNDAIHWKQEDGVRKSSADWPSVLNLPDGSWRMYYHNGNSIMSATSSDGLNWTDEPGIRMDVGVPDGTNISDVSEPAVRKIDDKTFLMIYTGIVNQQYSGAPTGSNKMSLFYWATSQDGLNFDKKGVAVDSRNDEFRGQVNGPEIVKWSDGTAHLFFWSSKGIYDAALKNGSFVDPRLTFAKSSSDKTGSPPADPTLLKVGNKWFMYYQEHNKGIYYATLGG